MSSKKTIISGILGVLYDNIVRLLYYEEILYTQYYMFKRQNFAEKLWEVLNKLL